MTVIDYLIEKEIIKDLKEFQDLHSIRAFKINDKHLLDPNLDININDIKKIQVGLRTIEI